MFHFIELVKLCFIILIPLFLILTHRDKFLIFWVCTTISNEILTCSVIASVSPHQIVGLLYLPKMVLRLPQNFSSKTVKYLFASFILLIFLGIIYGFIFPWPDTTGIRPINQRAEGRSIIYLIRTIADLSLAFYIAHQARKIENISKILRYLLIGTTIASIGVLLEWITNIDIFSILVPTTREWDPIQMGRIRGFNGEPRMSGQICAFGILFLSGIRDIKWKVRIFLLGVHILGLTLTISTAGLVTLSIGILLLIITYNPSKLKTVFITIAALFFIFCSSIFLPNILNQWHSNVQKRLFRYEVIGPARNIGESIADRLEVFDASAVLFLWNNPQHIFIGVGPGLISLPASNYIPAIAKVIYGDRIDSIPHMGFFAELADRGLIGLFLWFTIFFSCSSSLYQQTIVAKKNNNRKEALLLKEASSFFIVFSGLYLLQARSIWFILLGIGLSASLSYQVKYRNS
ncbi:putative O-antigen ligase domain-containing protein [Candidatus Magnetomoraceae bacterium gMMP-1]